jgi:hypothetical protein
MSDNLKSFTDARAGFDRIYMNENYRPARVDFASGLRLLPSQTTALQALLDLEHGRRIIINTNKYRKIGTTVVAESNVFVLSEKIGSGKTFIILGLILSSPVPRAFPLRVYSDVTKGFSTEVTKTFTGPAALIRANLIIVGSNVLVQWEDCLATHTTLRVFTIYDVRSIRALQQIYASGELRHYDVVLLKNGSVTDNIAVGMGEYSGMIDIVGAMTAHNCWARAIYDDYDVIKMPRQTMLVNALSTILVSSTSKQMTKMVTDISNSLVSPTYLYNVARDKMLFNVFNVANHEQFIEKSCEAPVINSYSCVCKSPHDTLLGLIGQLGTCDIMEMLNGDAINTACEMLGITSHNMTDIFKRVLDKQYATYIHAEKVLGAIEASTPAHHGAVGHTSDHSVIRNAILGGAPYSGPQPSAVAALLNEIRTEYQSIYDISGRAIQRVKDNIKESICQICTLPLDEGRVFIIRCCGIVVCEMCGVKGNNLGKQKHNTKAILRGVCANCKRHITDKDLILVDEKVDIMALPDVTPADLSEPVTDDTTPKCQKLDVLGRIMAGEQPGQPYEIHYSELMQGTKDIPMKSHMKHAGHTDSKFLIFAAYNETLALVQDYLSKQHISHAKLCGNSRQKAEIVRSFRMSGRVLLINAHDNCAGIDMPFATHVIFFHKMFDDNVSAQVIGRCQRIGRTQNLQVYFIMYDNETKWTKIDYH